MARSARGRAATTTNVPIVYRPIPPPAGSIRNVVVQVRSVERLFCRRPRRQRRFEWIDDRFAERGAVDEHHCVERGVDLVGPLAAESDGAARVGELREVDRLE